VCPKRGGGGQTKAIRLKDGKILGGKNERISGKKGEAQSCKDGGKGSGFIGTNSF